VPPPDVRVSGFLSGLSTPISWGNANGLHLHTKILPFPHFVPHSALIALRTRSLYTLGAICQIGHRAHS